jgi:GT2 family glycosyltransferase
VGDDHTAISVVVPSYNSRRTIVDCLASLQAAAREHPAEVVVVDSSSDGTDEIIASRFPGVRVHHRPERMLPGAARNLGAGLARGALLAFTDADCVVPTSWFRILADVFGDHPEEAACAGCVRNGNPGAVSWVAFVTEFSGFFGRQRRRPAGTLPTACAAYRREAFLACGPFPEDLWPGEDTVLSSRLRARGMPAYLEPGWWVHHTNRSRLREFLGHQARLGLGFARSRAECPDLPGAAALRGSRLAVPLLAGWRAALAYGRTFRSAPQIGLLMLVLWPVYLMGSLYWMRGLWRGRREGPGRSPEGLADA